MTSGSAYALALLCCSVGFAASATDQDRDGLSDQFEQAILEKFVPTFHVSEADCDRLPAEFEAGTHKPTVKERNGTIYGQVFRVKGETALMEVHYYHLWGRDCGQPSHPLDTESVSVLVRGDRDSLLSESWRAEYWYAAAHENTLCDMSNGAAAKGLGAIDHGPDVWVSRNKHASFLSERLCAQGCGMDQCEPNHVLPIAKLVNIGEPNAPMNGSDWLASPSWPLVAKMRPDFSESVIARMPTGGEADLVPARDVARGMRTTVRVAGHTAASLASANASTEAAIGSGADGVALGINAATESIATSSRKTNQSLKSAYSSTRNSIKRSFRWMSPRKADTP